MKPTIKIDKKIPLPFGGRGHTRVEYPLEQMQVGDSFFVEQRLITSVRQSLYRDQRATGRLYTTRIEADGLRIWRIK